LGSFSAAAKALSLTQPAVSHHISSLEKDLGVTLFIRKKNGIALTKEGEIVKKYANRLKAMTEGMKGELWDTGHSIERLRVGITHTAESNSVAQVLAAFGIEHPNIVITIITDTIRNLYVMLENYELDLAIVESTPNNRALNSLLLDTDYLVCAICNENPLAKKSMVTINDLLKERMILRLAKSGTVNLFVEKLGSLNRSIDEFNVILEVDNIATIKDLVRLNMGVSILPRSTCLDEVRKGKMTILPVENMSMARETNIVYQNDFGHMEILNEILELYRKNNRRLRKV
ncbi:MAG: LysR family transcriptional regulator, partial [Firmicutes bacterium]|nr:LysR family transcriptional regulator [Bacillota bacterium]